MLARSTLILALASFGACHFLLEWPPSAGFVDDDEPTEPCGGQTVNIQSSSPQIPVGRFAVSIKSSHPTGNWSFRATTDTEAPYTFTDIAAVESQGIGEFCLTEFTAPSDWAGKSGVLQVIDYSIDGNLYQCAPVQFTAGSNSSVGSTCSNTTGFSATWESAGASTSGENSTTTTSASSSSGAPTPATASSSSSTGAAAMMTGLASGIVGGLVLAAGLAL